EQFMLNYIIDFTEKDFATKLVAEINEQSQESISHIPAEHLSQAAAKRGVNDMQLMMELYQKGYITDIDRTINPAKFFDLYAEYPELNVSGVPGAKVQDRNAKAEKVVKIRSARYADLRKLWEELNRNYIIFFDNEVNKLVENSLLDILDDGVFSVQAITSHREQLGIKNGTAIVMEAAGTQQLLHGKRIPYRDFLRRANRLTSIPVPVLHNAIVRYSQLTVFHNDYINETSLVRLINKFNDWKAKHLQERFNYRKAADGLPHSTALTMPDGSPKEVIAQGRVGIHMDNGIVSEKFLYDTNVYDSPLERENVMAEIDEVVVYGKIPRNSISIPTIADSSYSPDFMYVVRKSNGENTLNVVIESKSTESEISLRDNENIKISCAKRFFEQLKIDGYTVHFKRQLSHEKMKSIIDEILKS
ncbi:MAG: type III restriction-modification system endonuclease, partial [Lachnospiraceae bacterium]|nr:type III restriction-modification system endonuclease [Lachnospiraceae bacterium]